jgi:hypothetical protein
MYKCFCPYRLKGCSKRFRSQSGRTYHVRSAHGDNHNILHKQTGNEPKGEVLQEDNQELLVEGHEEDYFTDAEHRHHHDLPPSAPASPIQLEAEKDQVHLPTQATPQRSMHPHINGIFLKLSLLFFSFIKVRN